MAESPVVGLRIPAELLSQIDALIGQDGKTRSEVMLTLVKRALGIAADPDIADVLTRLEAVEGKVTKHDRIQQQLTEAQQLLADVKQQLDTVQAELTNVKQRQNTFVRQSLTRQAPTPIPDENLSGLPDLQVETPQKRPKPAVEASRSESEHGAIGDKTMRRWAKLAGIPPGEYWQQMGFERTGTSNRAKYKLPQGFERPK